MPGAGRVACGGWDVGGILNGRSGLPIAVLITRPDIVYVDGAGNVFNNPAADRTRGHQHAGRRRVAQHAPAGPGSRRRSVHQGRRAVFLNPAAFATPKPGTFGNLERNSIHGPSFRQVDLVVAKRLRLGRGRTSSSGRRSSTSSTSPTSPTRSARCRTRCRTPALHRGEPRAAGPAVHGGRGGHLRPARRAPLAAPSVWARRVRSSSRCALVLEVVRGLTRV